MIFLFSLTLKLPSDSFKYLTWHKGEQNDIQGSQLRCPRVREGKGTEVCDLFVHALSRCFLKITRHYLGIKTCMTQRQKNFLFQDHIVVNIVKPPLKAYSFSFKIYSFVYFTFGLWWVFVPVCGLSLLAVRGDYSSLQCTCFSLGFCVGSGVQGLQQLQCVDSVVAALRLQNAGSAVVVHGLKSAWAQWLWPVGLVVSWHVGSQFPDQGSNPHPLCWKADS